MKKIFLLFIIFLLIISISKAQDQSPNGYDPDPLCNSPPGGVEIDGKCFDCGNNADGICPDEILDEVYGGYFGYCQEDQGYPDDDCPPIILPCLLNSASIDDSNCMGNCDTGETIAMSGSISNDCSAATYFQIDASETGAAGGICDVQYTTEDISGITSIVTIGSTATNVYGTWPVINDKPDCYGKTVIPYAATLWQGIPGSGIWLAGTSTISNTFTFGTPMCTCTPWIDQGCGLGGCAPTQMHKTRTSCNPINCDDLSICVDDASCGAPTECDTDDECPPTPATSCSFSTCNGNVPQGTYQEGYCDIDKQCKVRTTCYGSPCGNDCCLDGSCIGEGEIIGTPPNEQYCLEGNWEPYQLGECGTLVCNEDGCIMEADHIQCDNDNPNYICENQGTVEAPDFVCQNLCLDPRVNECCYCYSTCKVNIDLYPDRAPYSIVDCVPHTLFEDIENCPGEV